MKLLLKKIHHLEQYQQLLTQIQAGKTIPGLGLPRAARLPILASLHADLNLPILLITDRADHALSLFDELGFWVKSPRIYLQSRIHFSMKRLRGEWQRGATVCRY